MPCAYGAKSEDYCCKNERSKVTLESFDIERLIFGWLSGGVWGSDVIDVLGLNAHTIPLLPMNAKMSDGAPLRLDFSGLSVMDVQNNREDVSGMPMKTDTLCR